MKTLKLIIILGIFSFLTLNAAEEEKSINYLQNTDYNPYQQAAMLSQPPVYNSESMILPGDNLELLNYASVATNEFEELIDNEPNFDFKPQDLLKFALLYFIQDKFVLATILLNEVINNENTDPETLSEANLALGRIYEINADKFEIAEHQLEFEDIAHQYYKDASSGPKIEYSNKEGMINNYPTPESEIEFSLSLLDLNPINPKDDEEIIETQNYPYPEFKRPKL